MPMSKIKDIKLETTATYQPLSDLNVRFWSQDKNTAELRFIITRNQFPLSLSKENVKVIIALESGSSFISSDDFIIDSEVEGVARYIIPTDFMRVASNVTGQVYVTTLDKEEIIVERQFKFTVSNDLLNDYPSEDKLRYIKTFDDLRNEIASRVSKLESDMETMEDYVVQVQDTTQEGITALTNLIKQKQDAYNANHTAKMKELNDKGSEYSAKFDDDKVYMDDKFQAFQESVNGSGLITTGQSKDWQKYKFTDDDGNYPLIDLQNKTENYYGLKTGVYYTTNTPHNISGVSTDGFSEMKIRINSTVKRLTFKPYNSNRIFEKWFYNEWSDWKEIVTLSPDEKIETQNSAESRANETLADANQYTDEQLSKQHNVLFEGSANGVGTSIKLTDDYTKYKLLFISGSFGGGDFTQEYSTYLSGKIVIQKTNVSDSDGNGGGHHELIIEKINNKELKIINDVFYDFGANKGSGPNANRFTVEYIEGWK